MHFPTDLPNNLTDGSVGPQIWLGGRARPLPQWTFVNGEPVITQGRPSISGLIDNLGMLVIIVKLYSIVIRAAHCVPIYLPTSSSLLSNQTK